MAYDFDASGTAFKVYKSGRPLSDSMHEAIRSVRVEMSINLPSVCEVEFIENPDQLGASSYSLAPNDELAVYAYAAGNITGTLLFKGRVHSSEIRVDPGLGARSIVRLFDTAHDMLSATRTVGFKQMTYSDVVRKIAKNYDLDPFVGSAIASTPTKFELVVQSNESDWDFICRLARSVGYVAYVKPYEILKQSRAKLYFGPSTEAKTGPGSESKARGFAVGDGRTIALRALVTGAGLPSAAGSAGWDTVRSQPATQTDSVSGKALATATPSSSQTAFASAKAGTRTMLEQVATTKPEATALAKSYSRRLGAAAVDIELVVRGHPAAAVNTAIYIDGAGQLEGKYTISAVTHEFNAEELGFTTTIYCSGMEDRTIAGIQGEVASRPVLTGVYPAVVSSINDPENRGRVQLTLPWLDPSYVTGWVPLVQMGAGAGTGWQVLPAPKDEVLVSFENGQLDAPYVIGGIFGSTRPKESPGTLHSDGTPTKQVFTSRSGHQIIVNDDDQQSGVTIHTKNGQSCTIALHDTKGITISTTGDNKPVTITTDADVSITAKKNAKVVAQDVTVDAKGKVNVSGKGEVSVSGQSVKVDASGSASLKGASVTVSASGSLNLEASGAVNIKGSVVNLN